MTWTPRWNVFDGRGTRDAMVAFFRANQADALAWANAGAAAQLPAIKDFHKSARLVTVFPALSILQFTYTTDPDDELTVNLSAVFEFAAIHGDLDALTDRSARYAMAVESMLANLPETTFNAGSYISFSRPMAFAMETVFDVPARFRSQYIQVFQTQAAWQLRGTAPALPATGL